VISHDRLYDGGFRTYLPASLRDVTEQRVSVKHRNALIPMDLLFGVKVVPTGHFGPKPPITDRTSPMVNRAANMSGKDLSGVLRCIYLLIRALFSTYGRRLTATTS